MPAFLSQFLTHVADTENKGGSPACHTTDLSHLAHLPTGFSLVFYWHNVQLPWQKGMISATLYRSFQITTLETPLWQVMQ